MGLNLDMSVKSEWKKNGYFKEPDPEKVKIRQDRLDKYWYWIHERQEIWNKRVNLEEEAPWTEDEILQTFKFTHAVRDLDKLTIYYIENILSELEDDDLSKKNVIINTMIYRLFCRLDTWESFGFLHLENWEEEWTRAKEVLRERRAKGYSMFTSAYYVNDLKSANPNEETNSNKVENAICLIEIWKDRIDETYRKAFVEAKTMKEQIEYFTTFPAIGEFTAYEWCCDFCMAERYTGIKMVDWDDDSFTNVGPGCKRGLKWIFEDFGNLTPLQAVFYLRSIAKSELKRLGYDDLKLPKQVNINLRTIEHSCCEFQKYMKASTGEGRPKVKFKNETKDLSKLRIN